MIRLGKLTDYALVLMTHLAEHHGAQMLATRELAAESKLPLPTVTKLLKVLHGGGLLVSHRGANGGYVLAKDPNAISVAEIVAAIEGSIALTECSTAVEGLCTIEPSCPIRSNLQIINRAVRQALEGVTLADLAQPFPAGRYTDHETVVVLQTQTKRVS
jgi:FeS assembly SUF system regulator